MKHTKGKWEWYQKKIRATRRTPDCIEIGIISDTARKDGTRTIMSTQIFDDNPSWKKEELLANAKLIASAPELLEALKEIYKTACDAEDKDRSNGWVRDIKDIADLQLEAIKKAEGHY